MAYLADMALQHQCGRFEWMVLNWNEGAINFYQSLGATVLADWRICRLGEAELPLVYMSRWGLNILVRLGHTQTIRLAGFTRSAFGEGHKDGKHLWMISFSISAKL